MWLLFIFSEITMKKYLSQILPKKYKILRDFAGIIFSYFKYLFCKCKLTAIVSTVLSLKAHPTTSCNTLSCIEWKQTSSENFNRQFFYWIQAAMNFFFRRLNMRQPDAIIWLPDHAKLTTQSSMLLKNCL